MTGNGDMIGESDMAGRAIRKVAVTGYQGFIGRHLVADLRAAKYEVRGLGRGPTQRPGDYQTEYDAASLTDALQGMDAVIHLAGRRMTREDDPHDLAPFLKPNVKMIGDLVRACRSAGVRRIVLASTIAVYAPDGSAPYHEGATRPRPINAYALSKLMAEAYLDLQCRDSACNALSLRIAATYGAGEKGTPALMRFISQATDGETLVLKGNPAFLVDQIYVKDVTRAFIAALEHPQVNGVLNIGGGRGIPVFEMAETVNDVFGQPGRLDRSEAVMAPSPDTHMDIAQSRVRMGWAPRFSLHDGLTDLRAALDHDRIFAEKQGS